MDKNALEHLIRRVETLEQAVETMLGAFREDLAAVRAELVKMKAAAGGARPAATSPSGSYGQRGQAPGRKPSTPTHHIAEESVRPGKKDPRAD
jgi:hypothetical protein